MLEGLWLKPASQLSLASQLVAEAWVSLPLSTWNTDTPAPRLRLVRQAFEPLRHLLSLGNVEPGLFVEL